MGVENMAIIKCKECGNNISSEAKSCPKCGYNNKKNNKIFMILGVILVICIIIMGGFLVSKKCNSNNENNIVNQKEELSEDERNIIEILNDFKTNLRNPESLQVYGAKKYKGNGIYSAIFIIDVGGENGFGGIKRNLLRYGIINENMDEESAKIWANSGWDTKAKPYVCIDVGENKESNRAQSVEKIWNGNTEICTIDISKIKKEINMKD